MVRRTEAAAQLRQSFKGEMLDTDTRQPYQGRQIQRQLEQLQLPWPSGYFTGARLHRCSRLLHASKRLTADMPLPATCTGY